MYNYCLVIRAGWVMEKTIEAHLDRIKERFSHGRQILATIREPNIQAYEVPDVTVDRTMLQLNLPEEQDRYVDTHIHGTLLLILAT
jgi:tRNA isopentenyl-2-thiomethyl-A-37 hydroxylase MiaE